MRLRDAAASDADAIRSVHYNSIKRLGEQAYSQEQVDAWAEACKSADYTIGVDADEVEYLVAEKDGEVVGFGRLLLASPSGYEATVDGEVVAVYVHPSVAREGIGTKLYKELERRARAQGTGTLGLKASRNAVPFYEAHGYEQVREYLHEFSSHKSTGVKGIVVEMMKTL